MPPFSKSVHNWDVPAHNWMCVNHLRQEGRLLICNYQVVLLGQVFTVEVLHILLIFCLFYVAIIITKTSNQGNVLSTIATNKQYDYEVFTVGQKKKRKDGSTLLVWFYEHACACTVIMSSSSAAGDAGLNSPSEWSEDAFLFLFFAPTRVIVL